MRLEKVVELRDGVKVTVRELTPKILRNLLVGLPQEELEKQIADFFIHGLEEVISLLGDCIEIEGVSVQELSFSEIEKVWEAFREVNRSFFALLTLTGAISELTFQPKTQSEILKNSASASRKKDLPTSGTTAGV